MRFRQYRDEAHRNNARSKREDEPAERIGQILSPAAPSGYWIMPTERREGDPKIAFRGHQHAGKYWVLESEQDV